MRFAASSMQSMAFMDAGESVFRPLRDVDCVVAGALEVPGDHEDVQRGIFVSAVLDDMREDIRLGALVQIVDRFLSPFCALAHLIEIRRDERVDGVLE